MRYSRDTERLKSNRREGRGNLAFFVIIYSLFVIINSFCFLFLSIYIDFPIDIESVFVITDSIFVMTKSIFETTNSLLVIIDSIFIIIGSIFIMTRLVFVHLH